MAAKPSPQEIKQLLEEHQRILASLISLQDAPSHALENIRTILSLEDAKEGFNRAMEGELLGLAPSSEESHVGALFQELFLYRESLPFAQKAEALQTPYEASLKMASSSLKPFMHPLRWFFTLPKKKAEAWEAYEFLTGSSQDNVRSFVAETGRAIDALPAACAKRIPTPEESAFFWDLLRAKTQVPWKEEPLPALTELLASLKECQNALRRLNAREETSLASIESAVVDATRREVEAFLSEIPVEEIGRDQRGLRVNLLRESGYHSITDVYCTSAITLSSIKGIGNEMARRMKEIVEDYARSYRANVPLRLSAEDDSEDQIRLLRSLYSHLQNLTPWEEMRKSANEADPQVTEGVQTLSSLRNVFAWPFLSEEVRRQAKESFTSLKGFLAGDYGQIPQALEDSAKSPTKEEAKEAFLSDPISFYNLLEDLYPGMMGSGEALYGLPEGLAEEIGKQQLHLNGLSCHLRKYQEWGVKYILHQGRVLLGDEMGLGKTIQAIAAMVSLKNSGGTHFLVICPASVLPGWCKEIAAKSDLLLTKIHGKDRAEAALLWKKKGGVGVTTYEACQAISLSEEESFDFLVVDEAHYIKNPKAQRSVQVRSLAARAGRLLFMTGTALENRVAEMISLLDVLSPSMALQAKGVAFMASTDQFQQKIAQVYYRRKREDVLKELPDLLEMQEWCEMNPAEEKVYEDAVLSGNYAEIRRVSWNAPSLSASSKAGRLLELVEEAASEGRKVLVFSFFLDTIQKVGQLLGDRATPPINGSVPPARRQQILDDFEKAPAGSVLLAQILAGGTGLNIQSANVVILCEPQLKPSIENQAISRAYRMGQARNVLVYRLLCENTVDEKLLEVLKKKQAIFDAFADQSALSMADENAEVDTQTFGELVKEEKERIEEKRAEGK